MSYRFLSLSKRTNIRTPFKFVLLFMMLSTDEMVAII